MSRKHVRDWASVEKANLISDIEKEILSVDKLIALITITPATAEEAARKEVLLIMSREQKKYLESRLENIRKELVVPDE